MDNNQSRELIPTPFGSVVRAALNAFPLGGVVACAWSEWDTSRRFSRIEETLNELRELLELHSDRFDAHVLREPEMQLLESALDKVQREHREAKRRHFARLLAYSWTTGVERPFEERMRFIAALDEFDELHIAVCEDLFEVNFE